MPSLEDIRLAQLSVAHGLCQPQEVEECLALQHRAEQTGANEHIGDVLVKQGYLTHTQLERLSSMQRDAEQKVSRIGPYDLIRKLGEGGMGAVYQAKDTRNGQSVALKVLPRSRAKDKIFVQRFEQEARSAFELDHPNIVNGLDIGHADGYHFLVMEFVEGRDVYSLLHEKGRLPEAEALAILEQIAAALDHIHGEKLVHRDIKPENILIDANGVAKLADMGLTVDSDTQGRRRITQAGIAMGTPFYLSPEQIEGKNEPDIRSDIYALGITVYEMVTGRPPFEGETPAVVMMKHLNEYVPSPHDIDRGISLHFCHVLEKMTAKNPLERYQNPAELLIDLKRVRDVQTPLGERPAPGRSSVSRPQYHDQSGNTEKTPLNPILASGSNESLPFSLAKGNQGGLKPRRGFSAGRQRMGTGNQPISSAASLQSYRLAIFIGVAVALAVMAYLLISVLRTG